MGIDRAGAANVEVPATKLAREATELIRDTTSELIYHRPRRVYFFGSLQGRTRDLSFDPELLYIAAMFHDVGLGDTFHVPRANISRRTAAELAVCRRGCCVQSSSV